MNDKMAILKLILKLIGKEMGKEKNDAILEGCKIDGDVRTDYEKVSTENTQGKQERLLRISHNRPHCYINSCHQLGNVRQYLLGMAVY